jgi:tRNA(Ile)-lysidine synthase
MLNRIQKFIDSHQLLERTDLHLVGLSGGADSVALLLILRELGYLVEAAHCNFRLRGEESDRDETFVKELCSRLGIPLHLIHFDTKSYAELHQVSIEMAARDLRYGYFRELCKDIRAADVCIAHHRDDAVETLLMNLLRGAGIHGLTGIRPKNGIVRRPLLCINRQEILDYLESIGQAYVTDSTNLEADVLRNKVRLRVLPLLEEIAPGAIANIDKTANYLREAEKVYNEEIENEKILLMYNKYHKSISVPSLSSLLHEWLSPLGFNSTQTEQIVGCMNQTGREFHSATHTLVVDREFLELAPIKEPIKPLKIPEPGTYRYEDQTAFKFEIATDTTVSRDDYVATLDADKVQFPLTVRLVQQGDRFAPFGMKRGTKLVSDYMTDQKLSILEKRHQKVVTDATGAIVWVIGLRTDNRFRISNDTKRSLRITIK